MFIEVSIGEAIDKLNILELKMKKIVDEVKKKEIQKEINALGNYEKYKHEHAFYYNLLTYVNETIWDKTDIMKQLLVTDTNFAELSNDIFTFNQKRFRIKNWFNLLFYSNIKEQKSYGLSSCEIIINDKDIFYKKIPELNFLLLEYDSVTIVSSFNDTIKNITKIPTITFLEEKDTNLNLFVLDNYEIPSSVNKDIFEFIPLTYISGGLLGDFVHQLSVVKEKFLKEGRKGILYITDKRGDNFRKGHKIAFADTYNLVTQQEYIKEYKIHNDESFDIDLSQWRTSPLVYNASWYTIFNSCFNIEWGKHKWIHVSKDKKWENTIFINCSTKRQSYNINYIKFKEKYGKNTVFITLDESLSDYYTFKEKYSLNIDVYYASSIYELCVALNSCKFFIGNLSSPLAFSYAMHINCVVGFSGEIEDVMQEFEVDTPNIINCKDIKEIFNKAITLFDT